VETQDPEDIVKTMAMDEVADTMNTLSSAVDELSATVGEIAKNSAHSKSVTDGVVSGFEMILAAVKDLGVRAEEFMDLMKQFKV